MPDPEIFFWIAVSVADAGADNPNGIKTLLPYGARIFFVSGKPNLINGPRNWAILLFDLQIYH